MSSQYLATIRDEGNGIATSDEYVSDGSDVWRIVRHVGPRQTGRSPGAGDWQRAVVEEADWSDVDDETEPYCSAVVEADRSVAPADVAERVCALYPSAERDCDGLAVIVREALRADPETTDDRIVEIVREAEAEAEG